MDVVAELVNLNKAVQGAALVITGEGRFDAQACAVKRRSGWRASPAAMAYLPVVVLGYYS